MGVLMSYDDAKTILPASLHRVCHAGEIVEGTVRGVEIGDRQLALYNVGGTFYATDDICTHVKAYLSKGVVDGDTIECPLHKGRFHIPTGRPLTAPVKWGAAICVYPVQVMDGEIYVQIAENETKQE